jgi:hypothetical protein
VRQSRHLVTHFGHLLAPSGTPSKAFQARQGVAPDVETVPRGHLGPLEGGLNLSQTVAPGVEIVRGLKAG